MSNKVKADNFVCAICTVLEGRREQLAAAESALRLPSSEDCERMIRQCVSSRTGGWRKTKPDSVDDDSLLLWEYVKFHRGNGSLWGHPGMLARGCDKNLHDRIDTLAMLLTGSPAGQRWHRAVHGR
jgi:hypothetical protein